MPCTTENVHLEYELIGYEQGNIFPTGFIIFPILA